MPWGYQSDPSTADQATGHKGCKGSMMSDPSHSRITIHVAEDHEDWLIHGLVAVQLTFPVPEIRIEDAGSRKKVIEPVIEQPEAAGYRWNAPHSYVMELFARSTPPSACFRGTLPPESGTIKRYFAGSVTPSAQDIFG